MDYFHNMNKFCNLNQTEDNYLYLLSKFDLIKDHVIKVEVDTFWGEDIIFLCKNDQDVEFIKDFIEFFEWKHKNQYTKVFNVYSEWFKWKAAQEEFLISLNDGEQDNPMIKSHLEIFQSSMDYFMNIINIVK